MGLNNIANMGVTLVAAQHADGGGALGAGVIGHVEDRADLEHKLRDA